MSVEIVVIIVSGIIGLAVTLPLWIECYVTLRVAQASEREDQEGLIAVAAEDLVHETVRLAIILIFLIGAALTILNADRFGPFVLWAIASIPALVAISSLYAHKTRRDVRRTSMPKL